LGAAVGDMLGPLLAVPVAKLVPPAGVGKPSRRCGPLPPPRHRLRRRRRQQTASPVAADRDHQRHDPSSEQQDEAAGK
jgi:hypothetical protein